MKSKKNGFSLIESIVVISVIMILTAGVFINYRQGQNQMNLQRTGYKIATALRKVQTTAGLMDTTCCPGSPAVCTYGSSYKYSYGLYFETVTASKYRFFADCNGNGRYDGAVTDHLLETADLEPNIVIDKMNGGTTLTYINFVFLPPEPYGSFIDSAAANLSPASISVKVNGTTSSRVIQVNRAGMIDLN